MRTQVKQNRAASAPHRLAGVAAAVAVMASLLGVGVASPVGQHHRHIFRGLPATFSFKTVHAPQVIAAPEGSSVSSPSQLMMGVKSPKPTHIPVVVPVPKDFKGDAIKVTPEQLQTMGLQKATLVSIQANIENANAPIEQSSIQETIVPEPVEVDIVPEADISNNLVQEPISSDVPVHIEEPAPIESLAQVDESFVLTATKEQQPSLVLNEIENTNNEFMATNTFEEVQAEPQLIVEPEPEISVPIETQPAAVETHQPAQNAPVNPLQTDTFAAYNDFLNTWLRLASVNLNRPDLLNLIITTPRPTVPPQPLTTTTTTTTTMSPIPNVIVEKVEPQEPTFVEEPVTEVNSLTESATEDLSQISIVPEILSEVVEENQPQTLVQESIMETSEDQLNVQGNVVRNSEPDQMMSSEPIVEKQLISEVPIAEQLIEELPIEEPLISEVSVPDPVISDVPVEEPAISDVVAVDPVASDVPVEEPQIFEVAAADPVVFDVPVEEPLISEVAAPVAFDVPVEEIPSPNQIDQQPIEETLVFDPIPEVPQEVSVAPVAEVVQTTADPLATHNSLFLNRVPAISSRGRFSGFRYVVSHQPQRGTFFLHNRFF